MRIPHIVQLVLDLLIPVYGDNVHYARTPDGNRGHKYGVTVDEPTFTLTVTCSPHRGYYSIISYYAEHADGGITDEHRERPSAATVRAWCARVVELHEPMQLDDEPATCPMCDSTGCPSYACSLELDEQYRDEVMRDELAAMI